MSDDLSIPSPTYRIPRHHQGMDPATRRLAMIAGGLGGVLLVVVGGWTLIGHRNAAVPVVQADSRPIRVKPENPGGMQVAGADADILSGGTEMKDGKLGPAPEAPAPQALTAPPAPPPVVAAAVPAPAPVGAATPAKPVAAKPAPAAEKRPATPPANGALVQLTAVQSEDAARSEWQRLSKRQLSACPTCWDSASRRSARPSMTARHCGGCGPEVSPMSRRPPHSARRCVPRASAVRWRTSESRNRRNCRAGAIGR